MSEMKLIMENWRSYHTDQLQLLRENEVADLVSDALEQAMKDIEDKVDAEVEKRDNEEEGALEKKTLAEAEQLNESLAMGAVLVLWVKAIGILTATGVVAKIANYISIKMGIAGREREWERALDPASPAANVEIPLEKFASFLEETAKALATGGFNRVAMKLVDKLVTDPTKKQELKEKIDLMARIMVFIITVGAGINELTKGAEASGNVSTYFMNLAREADVASVPGMDAIGNLFEAGTDSMEFIKKTSQIVSKALAGSANTQRWSSILFEEDLM